MIAAGWRGVGRGPAVAVPELGLLLAHQAAQGAGPAVPDHRPALAAGVPRQHRAQPRRVPRRVRDRRPTTSCGSSPRSACASGDDLPPSRDSPYQTAPCASGRGVRIDTDYREVRSGARAGERRRAMACGGDRWRRTVRCQVGKSQVGEELRGRGDAVVEESPLGLGREPEVGRAHAAGLDEDRARDDRRAGPRAPGRGRWSWWRPAPGPGTAGRRRRASAAAHIGSRADSLIPKVGWSGSSSNRSIG